jgi:hypothetical protein
VVERRFADGLQIKIIREDERSVGFIEYTPGKVAWRPVNAAGYLFVHCLWMVGRAKEKGYGSGLLSACLEDARAMGKQGAAALTKRGGHLVGKKLFLKQGFQVVDRAPPGFELGALALGDARQPTLPQDWEERQARYGKGLTVAYADQCPCFQDAVQQVLEVAREVGIEQRRAVELESARAVQDRAPCPYGTFGVVYDGELVTCTPLSRRKLTSRLQELGPGRMR